MIPSKGKYNDERWHVASQHYPGIPACATVTHISASTHRTRGIEFMMQGEASPCKYIFLHSW